MLHVSDTHCTHILLGCCHDDDYIPSLLPLATSEMRSKISLIEHHRPQAQYLNLTSKVASLDGIFTEAGSSSKPLKRSKSPSPPLHNPRTQATAQDHFKVRLNRYGERIDIPLPHVRGADLRALNQRQMPKPCYSHYIFGPGSCSGRCKHSHDVHITFNEILVLAFQSRDLACKEGELNLTVLAFSLTNVRIYAQEANVAMRNVSMGIIVSK